MKIAMGKQERPPELDTFAAAFAYRWRRSGKGGGRRNAGFAKAILGQS